MGETHPGPEEPGIVVLIPLFNDWGALRKMLPRLDTALLRTGWHADVVVVDDGSTERLAGELAPGGYAALGSVSVLELRRNLGHQRAIAVGLGYVEARIPCGAVVVMDADGEDDPDDVPRLIEESRRFDGTRIVFAERTRRGESLTFRASYALYKMLHAVLTGHRVRVGNFSVIPRARLASLVVVSEMWSHYAAAAFASRQPRATIPTRRAPRLDGKTAMSYVQLVIHGLRAISVYRELVGVRILVGATALMALGLLGTGIAALLGRWSSASFPGWVVAAGGVALFSLIQAILFGFFLTFLLLSGRNDSSMLPARDYAFFVSGLRPIWPQDLPPRR